MSNYNVRLEVMNLLESKIEGFVQKYLIPVEKIWQPTDFLPNSQDDNFLENVTQLREEAKDLDYDFWVTLIGDTVTEEALPTYESWLMDVDGVNQKENYSGENSWAKWFRNWAGEENRHGDVLNKYLYLSGRVNMREVEITTHHLINDGFDPGTAKDPYKNFVFTSFQELATNISHMRVGKLAKEKGNQLLNKMCSMIAADEMRHHRAYAEFVTEIFKVDPSEMILAYFDMMKKKIVMPANLMKQSNDFSGKCFEHFSNVAQRLGVYTAFDYADIIQRLNSMWELDKLIHLTDEAEKARDYLMKLPKRMDLIAERVIVSKEQYIFNWVNPVEIKTY